MSIFAFGSSSSMDGCQSGRMGTPGKRVCEQSYRGFESLSIRHEFPETPASPLRSAGVFLRWIRTLGLESKVRAGAQRSQLPRDEATIPLHPPSFLKRCKPMVFSALIYCRLGVLIHVVIRGPPMFASVVRDPRCPSAVAGLLRGGGCVGGSDGKGDNQNQ